MKNILLLAALFAASFCIAQTNPNHVHVSGYTRSDGTYVAPHYRTAPNSTVNDKNTNPYTGEAGVLPRETYYSNTVTPYEPPAYNIYQPIEAIKVPSTLEQIDMEGATAIPMHPPKYADSYKPIKHDLSKPLFEIQQENYYYQPTKNQQSIPELYGAKPTNKLYEVDNSPKPSLQTLNYDIDEKYDLQKDGTYKLKGSSANEGIYWFVGLSFIGLVAFVLKTKDS
jgi:hypothetical protein